jgi:short-subunit dehydrogenase
MDLMRLCLADLAQTCGRAVFVGSTTSRVPLPHAAVYSATKSGLHAFCTALRYECTPLGVHVLEAYPPTVATAMTEGMRNGARPKQAWPARWQPPPTSPEEAGERIVAALAGGRQEVAWGAPEQLLASLQWVAPRLTAALLQRGRGVFARAFTRGLPPHG